MATGTNPTKIGGHGDELIPRLQQMMDGLRKVDPPTMKKLPVKVDVVEVLMKIGLQPSA